MYESRRKKIKDMIENEIMPAVQNHDVDTQKVIAFIAVETGASAKMVEEALAMYVSLGKIKRLKTDRDGLHEDVLTIPEQEIGNWLQHLKEEEERKRASQPMISDTVKDIMSEVDGNTKP